MATGNGLDPNFTISQLDHHVHHKNHMSSLNKYPLRDTNAPPGRYSQLASHHQPSQMKEILLRGEHHYGLAGMTPGSHHQLKDLSERYILRGPVASQQRNHFVPS